MKKVLCSLFISLYALCGVKLILEFLRYTGIPVTSVIELFTYVIWIFACYTAHRWMSDLELASMRVRKTILEEEEWIHPLMHELNLRSGIGRYPQLLVLERPEMNAYAIGRGTIVVSRGLLVNLSELEIKAVLAHEYGHLRNGDTTAAAAFGMATQPFMLLNTLTKLLFGFMKKPCSQKTGFWVKLLLLVLLAVAAYSFPELVLLLGILFIFKLVFPWFNLLIRGIYCYFLQSNEFTQDGFAQALGCGKHLKSALLKIDALDSGGLVNRITQFWLTHPMLYARIRRLEFLEGLRPTP